MEISIGSKVTCIDNFNAFGGITIGKEYVVEDIWHCDGNTFFTITDDKGRRRSKHAFNFKSEYGFSAPTEEWPNIYMSGGFPC
ncbi:MAG: hypothetical protein PHZ23_14630 [Acidiphilium sp.]|nr:hypothetical protein [Acidiphilium sp.]